MGKTKSEIAKPVASAITQADPYARPWTLEGEDQSDMLIPRLILHQGSISEQYYGEHPAGTLIDSTTQTVLPSAKFVATGISWKNWIKWRGDIGEGVEYNTRIRGEVPADDLEWHEDEPPAASMFYNFIVVIEGYDTPLCLSFKASSKHQRKAAKTLNQLEKIRAGNSKRPGLYALEVIDEKNGKNKWKDLQLKPIGDAPDDLAAIACQWFNALSDSKTIKIDDPKSGQTDAAGEYDPDSDN